jgi:type II secretory pathway component GspD/PulD (secretin)
MSRLLAAALLLLAQGLPVTRLAGGVPDQAATAQPAPQQPPAPPPLPVTQLDPGAAATTLDSPRRLSLLFEEPRPIHEVMRLLLARTPFSLAMDPDIDGTFRGELKQLTLREALTALLDPLGLGFEVHGTVIRVTRARTELRQFDINLLAVQRGLSRVTGPAGAVVSTTMQGEDVFAAIAEGVRALLSPDGKVHVDRRAGLAEVTDYPERLDRVALYIEALQVRSGRQVRLEARVLEVTLTAASSIDWRAVREKLGLPRDTPQAGLAADPAALQAALADQGEIRVLSAPDVTAMNNEPALVHAATAGVSSLTMTVVPQIASDGVVQLSVSHAWEEQDGAKAGSHTAEADTVARVMDGRTVMIAGLLRPAQVTVPGRGVGALFGGPAKKTVQAELVVLLRATVITPGMFRN